MALMSYLYRHCPEGSTWVLSFLMSITISLKIPIHRLNKTITTNGIIRGEGETAL